MYAPPHYREQDLDRMVALMRASSFAVLVSSNGGRLSATHLPMLIDMVDGRPMRLLSHMARANDHWRDLVDGQEVLAIFSGPDAYITPSWYTAEPDVPTWNYQAVHVRGAFRLMTDRRQVRSLLNDTVDHYERMTNGRWRLSDIDEAIVSGFERGVTAFEIAISSIEGATKHSQDKHSLDISGVVEGLSSRAGKGDVATAKAMKETFAHGGSR